MSEKLPIFIASNSLDREITDPVAECLVAQGHEVITYEADKVAKGLTNLTVIVDNKRGCQISYDDKSLPVEEIGAAWMRRPSHFGDKKPGETTAFRMSMDRERRAAQSIIFDSIPDERWLNSPGAIGHAQEKLQQLVLAQQVGFSIPSTVVSNNWESITTDLPDGDIAIKMFGGVLHHGSQSEATFTKRFARDELPFHATPFPSIAQEFVGKTREWRITVVGDEVFSAAIYTDETAKEDWRIHQGTEHVKFSAEPFPDYMSEKCHELMKRYENLRFGAFDFAEDETGITFLEMNPAGQYYWLEDQLGLPISRAIGSELLRLAA